MGCYVYMLRCSDGTLYTGWTNNLERRVKTHSSGKGAKYTKARLPITLVYYEEYEDKSSAMRREYEIKQLTKYRKEGLIMSKQMDILEGLKRIDEEALSPKKWASITKALLNSEALLDEDKNELKPEIEKTLKRNADVKNLTQELLATLSKNGVKAENAKAAIAELKERFKELQ